MSLIERGLDAVKSRLLGIAQKGTRVGGVKGKEHADRQEGAK